MNTYKITFSDGDYLYTRLNASIEEAKAYYLGNTFNLGTEADNLQIAAATLDEANAYYQDGGRYTYQGIAYTLRRYTDRDAHGDAVEVAQFVGIDGYNLFTDPARLGTFLPGVASDGQEITRF